MSDKIKEEIINDILDEKNKNIAITMHSGPDGDAIGSSLALEQALKLLNKSVDIIFHNKVPEDYSFLVGNNRINKVIKPKKYYDLVFLLDCADPFRTVEDISKLGKKIITIDHHKNCKPFGNVYLFEDLSSTGMIIYDIIKDLVEIDSFIATCIYLTIRSDTGSFKNNNTTPYTHKLAALLLEKGANIELINTICENKSLSLLKLIGEVSYNIIYDKKYSIIYLMIKKEHIKNANSNYEEALTLIDYIKNINNAQISYLFIENNEHIKVKARSKSVNVNKILVNFGGGGHDTAAGCSIYSKDIYRVANTIIESTKEYINNK